MVFLDYLSLLFFIVAVFFYIAGTVALFRFPDLYTRLHALTKADNVGLGFTVLAVALQAEAWTEVFKLGLIWVMVLISSACVCFLIANEGCRRGVPAWTRGTP